MEIERKWLLKRLPEWPTITAAKIEQGYLSVDNRGTEVRIRKRLNYFPCQTTANYKLTVKSDGDLSREEIEISLFQFQYEQLKPLCGEMITKEYHQYTFDGYTIEASIVDDGVFIYAEVEFDSEAAAQAYQFPWPDIVEAEITYNPTFKMKNYWKNKQ